jgi:hypothetical protein
MQALRLATRVDILAALSRSAVALPRARYGASASQQTNPGRTPLPAVTRSAGPATLPLSAADQLQRLQIPAAGIEHSNAHLDVAVPRPLAAHSGYHIIAAANSG